MCDRLPAEPSNRCVYAGCAGVLEVFGVGVGNGMKTIRRRCNTCFREAAADSKPDDRGVEGAR
jgi:hypothetical protein